MFYTFGHLKCRFNSKNTPLFGKIIIITIFLFLAIFSIIISEIYYYLLPDKIDTKEK
jgi:hypothetical protein